MSSPALEAFLARLYADESALAGFLADPSAILVGSQLDPAEQAALAAIDRNGLIMAARSFRAKRAGHPKSGRNGILRRMLRVLFG
jgi:hypothetical protein